MKPLSLLRSKVKKLRRRLRRDGEGPTSTESFGHDDFDIPSISVVSRHPPNAQLDDVSSRKETSKMSFLFELTKQWAWRAVEFRCQSHPHEVQLQERDSNGDTILHWACFGSPPLSVIDSILEVCPELASIPNIPGSLPLHTACCYRSSSNVIRSLLQAFPAGAGAKIQPQLPNNCTTCGYSALHLLCNYGCDVDSIQAILETESGVASCRYLDPIFDLTPLCILNQRKNLNFFHFQMKELRRLKRRELRNKIYRNHFTDEVDIQKETKILLERIENMHFWKKAQLLALAEYTQQSLPKHSHVSHTTAVHAFVGLENCPPALVEFAAVARSEDLFQIDQHGDLPLHTAAKHNNATAIFHLLENMGPHAASIVNRDGKVPLELYLGDGITPNRWNAAIHLLIAAFPQGLEFLNLSPSLYPIIWSRFSSEASNIHESTDLDIIYAHLQSNPSLFH